MMQLNLTNRKNLIGKLIFFLLIFFAPFCLLKAQDPLWQGYGASGKSQMPSGLSEDVVVVDPNVERFFLMKSGLLMQAFGTKGETHYEVRTEALNMQVPIENVEFIGENREQVWLYKKSQIDPTNCSQLMKLAEWCLNNNFQTEGIEQYQSALRVAPNDQLANFIRQRISTVKPPSDEKTNIPESGIHVAEIQDNDPELTRWVNGVPNSVFDTFSKKVQPILVQRCASAACHGSNSENQYKINIPRQSGGRTTSMNLRSSVQWIDTENPGNSPLLSALVTSHVGKKALFSVESDQYNHFVEWIQLAAKELPSDLNPQLVARLKNQQKMVPDLPIPSTSIKTDMLPKHLQESLAAQKMETTPTNIMNPTDYSPTRLVVPNAPVAEKTSAQKQETSDPFDPNRFNAKYHADIVKFKAKRAGAK